MCRRLVAGISESRWSSQLLAEHVAWHPQTGLHVGAPRVEVQVVFVLKSFQRKVIRLRVSSIDSDNCIILIFHPNSSDKARTANFWSRRHLKNKAPHLAQELPSFILELVMGFVECPPIDKNHLQEPSRLEGPQQRGLFFVVRHRVDFEPSLRICLAEEIDIGLRDHAHLFVGLYVLDVSLNKRAVKVERGHLLLLTFDNSIDDLRLFACRRGSLCVEVTLVCNYSGG